MPAVLHHPAHMISIQGLIKSYGTALAVDRLSFDVAAGEILGLIGQLFGRILDRADLEDVAIVE